MVAERREDNDLRLYPIDTNHRRLPAESTALVLKEDAKNVVSPENATPIKSVHSSPDWDVA